MMNYLKSFLFFLLTSVILVFNMFPSWGLDYSEIFNWEKLSSPPSRVDKLIGIFPDLYFTIVVKSENGQIYHNYEGRSDWFEESKSEFVISEKIPDHLAMKPCDVNGLMSVGFLLNGITVVECYEMYIQFPETSGYVKILLDQSGNIWENFEAPWVNSPGVGILFGAALLITIVLE